MPGLGPGPGIFLRTCSLAGMSLLRGGLITNQFRNRRVFAKRPFGLAIRPVDPDDPAQKGTRALLPYFQTGNFGVLDLQVQQRFQQAPPSGPPANTLFANQPGNLFQGVVGVTTALPLDNHFWPSRGTVPVIDPTRPTNQPGVSLMTTLPSPDEALLFPGEIQYAQNGRFAVATHAGSGPPREIRAHICDFEHDVPGCRLRLQDIGFTYAGGITATGTPGTLDAGLLIVVNEEATFRRGGGAVSIIDDRAITADFNAHAQLTTSGFSQGVERAYYSVFPVCKTVAANNAGDPTLPFCTQEATTRLYDYHTLAAQNVRFHRPRGIAIQPFVTFATPRFGDHVIGTGASVHVEWRDGRVRDFRLGVFDLDARDPNTGEPFDPPPLLGSVSGPLSADEIHQKTFKRNFTRLFQVAAPVHLRKYRIEAIIIPAAPQNDEELSRTHIDVTYEATRAPEADLVLTKLAAPNPVRARNDLTYTLTVTNQGPDTATRVNVLDTLPAGVTLRTTTLSQGTCSGAQTVFCDLGSLANGATATITLVVTANTPGMLTNTASVTGIEADPNRLNNRVTVTTRVQGADLAIAKLAAPNPVPVGSDLTYTLTVTNNGPDDATGVVLTDTLPTGVTWQTSTTSQGTCTGTSTVTCALGTLAHGATASVSIVVVDTRAILVPVTISNTATVTSASSDPETANNTVTTTATVVPPVVGLADLTVTVEDAPDPVSAGS
ncbi:MAG: DUF11 domain-containing protein, partial [Candidatus Tectomicrobia bacterium]|nr:DUF11 domain-containing protein [Candidatus Tectomicrobia bacterium]